MVTPLTSDRYLDLGLGKVTLKLNFEIRAENLALSSYRLDEPSLDSLNSRLERYNQLVVFDIVYNIMRPIIYNNVDSTCILYNILSNLSNLHDFNGILRTICI